MTKPKNHPAKVRGCQCGCWPKINRFPSQEEGRPYVFSFSCFNCGQKGPVAESYELAKVAWNKRVSAFSRKPTATDPINKINDAPLWFKETL